MDYFKDIIEEYFEYMVHCNSIECQKVIFEPSSKKEWFFENDFWCYFEFNCEDKYYRLKKDEEKIFTTECVLKDMSYEIKMLLAYSRFRSVVTIEKEMFSDYVLKYENAKEQNSDLSIEKFDFELKEKEDTALIHSDKIANSIMGGCLFLVIAVLLLFVFAFISYVKMKYFG